MTRFLTVKVTLWENPDASDQFFCRIDSSPLGASKGPGMKFKLPSIPNGSNSYPEYFKWLDANRQAVGSQLSELGKLLFDSIFQGAIRDKWSNIVGMLATTQDSKIRIALNILGSKLVSIPWEFLHDGNSFVSHNGRYSIVRVLDELQNSRKSFGPIINPMIIVANPGNTFNAEEHVAEIKKQFLHGNVREADINTLTEANPDNIFDFIEKYTDTDFLYFLGHGGIDTQGEGYIVLEERSLESGKKPLSAQRFADSIRKIPKLRLVYLNSCQTAIQEAGTFSGVAQKIMLNGDVVAVVAMQASILSKIGMDLANKFIARIIQVDTIEGALSETRSRFLADSHSWGIPVIYTQIADPNDFEKNQLLSFLCSPIVGQKYALCIPSFRETLLDEEMDSEGYAVHVVVEGRGGKQIKRSELYHFPGLTYAQSDVTAVTYIKELLQNVAKNEDIKIIKGAEIKSEEEAGCTFLFGSRSNTYVSQVLNGYQELFEMHYNERTWSIVDRQYKKEYKIPAPYTLAKGEWDKIPDYSIIQKIVKDSKTFFIIAGLGDRGTIGGSLWLSKNWKLLAQRSGMGAFEVLLRFPLANPNSGQIIERENNDFGIAI